MNLRNATIWTTGITLIATFSLVFVYFFVRESHYPNFSVATAMIPCIIIAVLCNAPLIVSCILLFFLKHPTSLALLFISTILYGIGMLVAFCSAWGHYECMSGIQFFGTAFTLFPLMLLAWIIALVLNWRYVKKSIAHTQSNENEVR